MQAFDDLHFPLDIGRRAQVSPAFSTRVIESMLEATEVADIKRARAVAAEKRRRYASSRRQRVATRIGK